MPIYRGKLRAFLEKHTTHPELLGHGLEVVDPFFSIADRRELWLKPREELDEDEIVQAILRAAKGKVKKITYLPIGNGFPKGGRKVDSRILSRIYDDSLEDMVDIWCHKPRATFGAKLDDVLEESLTRALMSIVYEFYPFGFSSPAGSAVSFLSDCLYVYLGLVMLGQMDKAGNLEPLIRLMAKAVPLGRNGKVEWIVLIKPAKE